MLDRRGFLSLSCKSLASVLLLSQLSGCSFLDPRRIIKGSMKMEGLRLTDQDILAEEAMYYTELENERVRCDLCFRNCKIDPGKRGYCGVRKNHQGKLFSLVYGNMGTVTVGPVEKKPLHQYKPGAQANNYGTAGCNLSCLFCHNWRLSQQKLEELDGYDHFLPEEALDYAVHRDVQLLSFTYNEPTVFYEMVLDTAKLGKKKGLKNILVTNGYMEKEPLKELIPFIDATNVDLKGFNSQRYRKVFGGNLEIVKQNIEYFHQNLHLEVTTLVVTGINDQKAELISLFQWLAAISPEIPLHLNRYYPSYEYHEAPTDIDFLLEMKGEAKKVLKRVRCGNF